MKNKKTIDWFILTLVPCPNCNGKLVPRPLPDEIRNICCEICNFSCRFETAYNNPNQFILSLPTDELERTMSEKITLPPLIIHFKWKEDSIQYDRVLFYPFIAYRFLKEEGLDPITFEPESKKARNTVFTNMFQLPFIPLFEQPTDDDIALIASEFENTSTSYLQRKFQIGYARASELQDKIKRILRKKEHGNEPLEIELDSDDDDEDAELI